MLACLSLLECVVQAQNDVPVASVPEQSGVGGLQLVSELEQQTQSGDLLSQGQLSLHLVI